MAIHSADNESATRDALRELASRQGEAFEAYARALKRYGDGSLPAEALAREVINLTARGTADMVRTSFALAQDFYFWAWSLAGVRIDPARTASSPGWAASRED